MGGCATKSSKLQAAEAPEEEEEDEVMVEEVVKKVVQVENKDIEGGRKSLSLLFMENKKEEMKAETEEEATELDVSLEQKPTVQNVTEDLKLVNQPPDEAGQEQKNATIVIAH